MIWLIMQIEERFTLLYNAFRYRNSAFSSAQNVWNFLHFLQIENKWEIVGFHMTSLKFKLQNYPSYWDFTFITY